MNVYHERTLDDVYPKLCDAIAHETFTISPRGIETRDIGPTTIVIDEPSYRILTNKRRKINPYFMIAEFLWIATRQNEVNMLGFYNKKMYDYSDNGRSLYGAYGPRLMYQLPSIVNKLKLDRNTRQAIATIFKPQDQIITTKDFPCNILLHFLPRGNRLDLITYVRSQDILLGLPYDFYHWSVIQEMVASEAGFEVGSYTHICGSLHGYASDLERLQNIADTENEDVIEFEEIVADRLPNSIRPIANLEYKIRRQATDPFILVDEIDDLKESQFLKCQLDVLLWYRARRSQLSDEDKDRLEPGIYTTLLKHMDWF